VYLKLLQCNVTVLLQLLMVYIIRYQCYYATRLWWCGDIKHCCNRPVLCPSDCLSVPRPSSVMVHLRVCLLQDTNETRRWKLKITDGHCIRNGNEAVANAASEAFTRWLHRRYALPCDTLLWHCCCRGGVDRKCRRCALKNFVITGGTVWRPVH